MGLTDKEIDGLADEAITPATHDEAPLAWDITRFAIFLESQEDAFDGIHEYFTKWAKGVGMKALVYTGE